MSCIFKGLPYRRLHDVEAGGSPFNKLSAGPFDITTTKNASIESLRRWRQAALVLNSYRRFRYTLDFKKEENKMQVLGKIRADGQALRAAYLLKKQKEGARVMSSIFNGWLYRRCHDMEAGSSHSGNPDDDELSAGPFNITSTKNASMERLHCWRQATLVLNSYRRFRYTLDFKKEEEKKEILRKIRANGQAIRAAYRLK